MNLTRASCCAALAHLARGNNKPVPTEEIAAAHGLTAIFLRKYLTRLERIGILRSQSGPGGGYRLARPPAKITLLKVIEAVEGTIRVKTPPNADTRLQAVADRIAKGTRDELAKVTLASLIGKGKKAR